MEKHWDILQIDAGKKILNLLPLIFWQVRMTEQMAIHGDPAITISEEKLPDYDIESSAM